MAKFKVAAVFSSNMVLQREKNIKIFGEGQNDHNVTVTFDGNTYTAKVHDEKWFVTLPPKATGTGYEMTVACDNESKKFENIAIGEVWLAGGQSNMEYELQNSTGGKEMLQNDKNPNVRFYYTTKASYMDDEFYKLEEQACWKEFNEENAKNWSAVGYIYGKKLAEELGVTVGIIGCNWGGTSASCWMSEEALSEDKELNTYLEGYHKAIEGKSEEEQVKSYRDYLEYHSEWDRKCGEIYKDNTKIEWSEVLEILGPCQWPGPLNCASPFRPSGLYHCMVQRIIPYTLRGFIYYQGEEDSRRPPYYQKLLTRLIRQWREDWEDDTLPFMNVQLPMHRYKYDPDDKSWCLTRESQMRVYQTVKNTGIAVTLDCGEFNDIHPKDKRVVGKRLALQALCHVYNKIKEEKAFGPIYKSFEYKDGGIEISFDYASEGFEVKGEAGGFEIAGEDLNYMEAKIEFRGSKVFLSSAEISNPLYARYCWTNFREVTIFGKNGIPVAPFRTNFNNVSES